MSESIETQFQKVRCSCSLLGKGTGRIAHLSPDEWSPGSMSGVRLLSGEAVEELSTQVSAPVRGWPWGLLGWSSGALVPMSMGGA